MHGYHRDAHLLETLVGRFIGGQFQIETRYGEVMRGEIAHVNVSPGRVVIGLKWFYRRTAYLGLWVNPKTEFLCVLDIHYTSYYFQDKWNRVKMWSDTGEVCRFFESDDHTNLVKLKNGGCQSICSDWRFAAICTAILLKT